MNKELVLQVINNLPDNATEEQISEALITIFSVMQGIKDFENGKFISQEELLEEIKKWQSISLI